jgi:hypothetical protein
MTGVPWVRSPAAAGLRGDTAGVEPRRAEAGVKHAQTLEAVGCSARPWVAYLLAADKYSGPLASRLSGVTQPVIRTRNAFSTLRLTQLVCL